MVSILTQLVEPYFSDPKRRDIFRRIMQSGMKKEKGMLASSIRHSVKSVLDIGCGTGEFSELFSPTVYHGVDTDKAGIEHAKRVHPKHKFSSFENISELKGKYDVIIFVDTIHHIPSNMLKKIFLYTKNRLLNENGKLVILGAVHPKEQKLLLGNWLFTNDRGEYQRKKEDIESILRGLFRIKSYKIFQENLLTFYLLEAILPTKESKAFSQLKK